MPRTRHAVTLTLSLVSAVAGCQADRLGGSEDTSATSGSGSAVSGSGSAVSGSGGGETGSGAGGIGAGGFGGGGFGSGGFGSGGFGSGGFGTGGVGTGPGPGGGGMGFSLFFPGNGGIDDARVKIRIDDPATHLPGPPLDVGDQDFTIEMWMRAAPSTNTNPAVACGPFGSFVYSNIIIDRDRHNTPRAFGIGIAGGVIVFTVDGDNGVYTLCGVTPVVDDAWHHVAVQRRRSDGRLWLHIDGVLEDSGDGPGGDVSYPDDATPWPSCPGGTCSYSDPFVVFGAEKHGYSGISYEGLLDEVRFSTALRYPTGFTPPTAPFVPDAATVGLFHFDEGIGTVAGDASMAATHGVLIIGGSPSGPAWTAQSPF